MSEEIWKPLAGFEKIYSISTLGRVRRDAPGTATYPGRLLKPSPNSTTYLVVGVTGNGHCGPKLVHQLMAFTFLGPRPPGLVINHKNGIKTDNRLCNLEYCTIGENQSHAYRIGIRCRNTGVKGSKNFMARLTESQVKEILTALRYRGWMSAFARKFNVNPATIQSVVKRRNWKHMA